MLVNACESFERSVQDDNQHHAESDRQVELINWHMILYMIVMNNDDSELGFYQASSNMTTRGERV